MSSRKNQPVEKESQDENYEAAVLDFLDKELMAAQPARNQNDQSAELDALVSDLLRQVITESDQQQDQETEPEDRASVISGLGSGQEGAADPGSGLLANLDRGLSQKVSEMDFWEDERADVQPPAEAARPYSALPPATKPRVSFPVHPPAEAESVPFAGPEKDKTGGLPGSSYHDTAFRPILTPKRQLPWKAIAVAGLLIVVAGALYSFLSPFESASKSPSAPPKVSASVPTAEATQVSTPADRPAIKAEKPKKAAAQPSRTTATATSPRAALAGAAQRPSPSAKTPREQSVQPPANNSSESTDPALLLVAASTMDTKAASEENLTLDRPAAAPPLASVPVSTSIPTLDAAASEKRQTSPVTSVPAETNNDAADSGPSQAAASRSRIPAPPVLISQAKPAYPEMALRQHLSASVVLELQIDANGKVIKATPVKGPAMFHYEAINAAMKWRYKPASIDGTSIPSRATVTMNFNLNK